MARNPSFCHSTFSAKYFAHDDLFAPATHPQPQHPRLQLAYTRSIRAHSARTRGSRSPQPLQVLRRKDIVPERAKLLDKLNVRRKPLHVKQLVLSKPAKL